MTKYIGLILACVCVAGVAVAGETILKNSPAPEGQDAVVRIAADDGDDTADILDIVMKATGVGALRVGGTEVVVLGTGGTLIQTGTVTNGQTVSFTTSFGSAPVVVIESTHATSNAYPSAVSTTNFTAVVPGAATNSYVAIGVR